jgi:hypothetical protein
LSVINSLQDLISERLFNCNDNKNQIKVANSFCLNQKMFVLATAALKRLSPDKKKKHSLLLQTVL